MPTKHPKPHTQDQGGKLQAERFIETARALECDEDKERFEAKLRKIAKAKPPTTAPEVEKKTSDG